MGISKPTRIKSQNQELARRRIKVLEDKGKQSFKTAMKADLVIAGSAVCASWIAEVDALKAEVTHLRAEGEQMKAQLRAQGKEMKTCLGRVQELVQAIQMSDLQISLPAANLAPPSTSEPSGLANPNSLMY